MLVLLCLWQVIRILHFGCGFLSLSSLWTLLPWWRSSMATHATLWLHGCDSLSANGNTCSKSACANTRSHDLNFKNFPICQHPQQFQNQALGQPMVEIGGSGGVRGTCMKMCSMSPILWRLIIIIVACWNWVQLKFLWRDVVIDHEWQFQFQLFLSHQQVVEL